MSEKKISVTCSRCGHTWKYGGSATEKKRICCGICSSVMSLRRARQNFLRK